MAQAAAVPAACLYLLLYPAIDEAGRVDHGGTGNGEHTLHRCLTGGSSSTRWRYLAQKIPIPSPHTEVLKCSVFFFQDRLKEYSSLLFCCLYTVEVNLVFLAGILEVILIALLNIFV